MTKLRVLVLGFSYFMDTSNGIQVQVIPIKLGDNDREK
jgi:hypothetical protein